MDKKQTGEHTHKYAVAIVALYRGEDKHVVGICGRKEYYFNQKDPCHVDISAPLASP
jgi:hypothetical protein